jgi:hypothetical protein
VTSAFRPDDLIVRENRVRIRVPFVFRLYPAADNGRTSAGPAPAGAHPDGIGHSSLVAAGLLVKEGLTSNEAWAAVSRVRSLCARRVRTEGLAPGSTRGLTVDDPSASSNLHTGALKI